MPLRPLRGSGFALGQPDAFGAGAFPLRSFAPDNRSGRAKVIAMFLGNDPAHGGCSVMQSGFPAFAQYCANGAVLFAQKFTKLRRIML